MRSISALCFAGLALAGCASADAFAPSTAPLVVAHRGGTADAPENTLEAIRTALANGADAMWLSVQVSRDGVPVLYRPADLSALTDGAGPVAGLTAAELARLNAGWQFQRAGAYPYRAQPAPIPTLADALAILPPSMTVMLDMKTADVDAAVPAVARVLDAAGAWDRALLYSTEAAYAAAWQRYPQARQFETRDATRARLLNVALAGHCDAPAANTWAGFELRRKLQVTETFTLGVGRTDVTGLMWTSATMQCFKAAPGTRVLAIAVNTAADYRRAACLGVDAILADSPSAIQTIRQAPAPACGNLLQTGTATRE